MQLRQDRRLAKSRAEHDAVMRAIAEGDGDEAARRMRAHMLNAASALDSYIAHQDALHIQPAKPEVEHFCRVLASVVAHAQRLRISAGKAVKFARSCRTLAGVQLSHGSLP